jgi:hypothetical protein
VEGVLSKIERWYAMRGEAWVKDNRLRVEELEGDHLRWALETVVKAAEETLKRERDKEETRKVSWLPTPRKRCERGRPPRPRKRRGRGSKEEARERDQAAKAEEEVRKRAQAAEARGEALKSEQAAEARGEALKSERASKAKEEVQQKEQAVKAKEAGQKKEQAIEMRMFVRPTSFLQLQVNSSDLF